jgi:hypothetical protein
MDTKSLTVSIPHRLGQAEALRRIKSGIGDARANYSQFLTIDEEVWTDSRLAFRLRALGQAASGTIDVGEDQVLLQVTLPWLLGVVAEKIVPTIRKEGTLLLEKKKS